ncbi:MULTISPECIES: ASCH domain-containing protein [Croceitalea]|uniref:ASCH domain-containing protein n=1 Tax=Croceitalea vernalis TaxID=3075599 RepID=A0ABU3BEV1_9FLAO|nr:MULTISPECIES: ASCH domain-containing protein [unclassified Croceitalea]MDT0538905.1 ASCH domain-containing protein [Croceitalea sp. P059]MDT0620692.1 ASCH domain-containing protein [Croceitalea sp. P007]
MENASARNLWGDFLDKHTEFAFEKAPEVGYFGDNEKDANNLAKLVQKEIKRATSYSLLGLQLHEKSLPKIGDFFIVTDWNGKAKCIIKTTSVKMMPYFSVHAEHARLEGEGDKSLEYWQKTHWEYYTRELEEFNRRPLESMIVVFERFEKVF